MAEAASSDNQFAVPLFLPFLGLGLSLIELREPGMSWQGSPWPSDGLHEKVAAGLP